LIDGGGEPDRRRRGGLRLHREVCNHVLHQGFVDQQAAESRPVGNLPRRLGDGSTQQTQAR